MKNQMFVKTVGNVTNQASGQKFFDKINGQTYMNFQVKFAPVGGSFDVIVESNYNGSKKEISGMLNYLMFCEINR